MLDDRLETKVWTTVSGLSINPIPADGFRAMNLADGTLKVANVGPAEGGALVSLPRPFLPVLTGINMPYIRVKCDRWYSSYELPNCAQDEFDLKVIYKGAPVGTSIPNLANFSTQLNRVTGMWQLNPANGPWVDTGFKVDFLKDQWQTIVYDFCLDLIKMKWGVLAVNWGGMNKFSPPNAFQNLPLCPSNWGAVIATLQIQAQTLLAGSVTILYDNVSIEYSEAPFS